MSEERAIRTVRKRLQSYADRGVLRSFSEKPLRGNTTAFSFRWLADKAFTIIVDPERDSLKLRDAFPEVPARSYVDGQIRRYLRSREDPGLPAHRRIDTRRAEVTAYNRSGKISLVLKVKKNQYAYGVKKLLDLLNELWNTLDEPYMWEAFDLPQE